MDLDPPARPRWAEKKVPVEVQANHCLKMKRLVARVPRAARWTKGPAEVPVSQCLKTKMVVVLVLKVGQSLVAPAGARERAVQTT